MASEWVPGGEGFATFLAHIGPKPAAHLSLDRIDNDKGYHPGNVRWADQSTQCLNQRRGAARKSHNRWKRISSATATAIYEANGTLKEVAAKFAVTPGIVSSIKRGKTWVRETGHQKT